MISFILGLAMLMAGASPAQCPKPSQTHGRLQWSEPAKIVAPDRAWQVDVSPVLTSDENRTPVSLRGCQEAGSWPLFTLQRSADIYWGSDSKNLLVVNEPTSDVYKLLLFDTKALSEGKRVQQADGVDKAVKQILSQQLGEKRRIEFYLPRFVSWRESNLVLAVGGATSSGGDGPMTAYCYGFLVDSSTLHVRGILSAKELKAKFGVECRVSP